MTYLQFGSAKLDPNPGIMVLNQGAKRPGQITNSTQAI